MKGISFSIPSLALQSTFICIPMHLAMLALQMPMVIFGMEQKAENCITIIPQQNNPLLISLILHIHILLRGLHCELKKIKSSWVLRTAYGLKIRWMIKILWHSQNGTATIFLLKVWFITFCQQMKAIGSAPTTAFSWWI